MFKVSLGKLSLFVVFFLSIALNLYLLSRPYLNRENSCNTLNDNDLQKEEITEPPPSAPQTILPRGTDSKTKAQELEFVSSEFIYGHQADGATCDGTIRGHIIGVRSYTTIPLEKLLITPKPRKLESVYCSYDSVHIEGVFEIGQRYTITLPAKIEIINHLRSGDDFAFSTQITSPGPYLNFSETGFYYPASIRDGKISDFQLVFKHLNVPEIAVELYRMEDRNLDISSNLIYYYYSTYNQERLDKKLMLPVGSKTIALHGKKDVLTQSTLDLTALLPQGRPGRYRVTLHIPNASKHAELHNIPEWEYTSCTPETNVILSDFGLTATLLDQGKTAAITVISLETLTPVSEADVTLVSTKRQMMAQGKTNADGALLLTYSSDYNTEDTPETVVVRKGTDISFLRLQSSLDTSDFQNKGPSLFYEQNCFLYTERGIYRPGETIHASAFLRHRDKDNQLVSSSIPCEMTLYDSFDKLIGTQKLKANSNGFLTTSFSLLETAPTGSYTLRCGLGEDLWQEKNIIVKEFVPDRIKVTVTPQTPILTNDLPLQFFFDADYYFGQKLAQGTVSAALYGKTVTANHWKGYTVPQVNNAETLHLASQEGVPFTSENKAVRFPKPSNLIKAKVTGALSTPWLLTGAVSVTEPGGNTITSHNDILYLPTPYVLGLKHVGSENDTVKIICKLLAWDPETEKNAPETEMTLSLTRQEWDYVLGENNDSIRREWKLVDKETTQLQPIRLKPGENPIVLPLNRNGYYRLSATVNAIPTVIDFWHWKGDSTPHTSNPNILVATSDKEHYLPGETAQISIKAAADGIVHLATGEARLTEAKTFPVRKGFHTIPVTIAPDTITGEFFAHLSFVYFKGDDLMRAFTELHLKCDQASHRLDVSLEMPQESIPEGEIELTLHTRTAQGTPVPATLQLFAVDEGILSLTGYTTPDIFTYFHGSHQCDFISYDIYDDLFQRLSLPHPAITGGDAASVLTRRLPSLKRKENAILVLPPLEIPESGTVTTRVKLPKHTGALRFMAVSANPTRVGSAEQKLFLRDEVNILANAPLAVTPQDTFTAQYSLQNANLEAEQGLFTLTLPQGISSSQTLVQQVTLPKGASQLLSFPLKATQKGSFALRYAFEIGGRRFTGESLLNVRSAIPYSTRCQTVILKPGDTYTTSQTTEKWEELEDQKLIVSAMPSVGLKEALQWLENYPYGCLEQTISCAFPYVIAPTLKKQGLITQTMAEKAQNKLDNAVCKIISMQRGSNGFTSWTDVEEIWTEASPYACHFLLKVNSPYMSNKARKNIIHFLNEQLEKPLTNAEDSFCQHAYALYILSLTEKKVSIQKMALHLLNRVDSDSLAAFFASAALIRNGNGSEGGARLQKALAGKAWNDTRVPWFLASETTRTAMVLAITMDIAPHCPEALLMALALQRQLGRRQNSWGSTRDNAWAVLGLASFNTQYTVKNSSFTFNCLAKESHAQPLNPNETVSFNLKKEGHCTLKNTGDSPIFLQEICAGIPSELQTPKEAAVPSSNEIPVKNAFTLPKLSSDSKGILITKEYLTADGAPIQSIHPGDLITVRITVTSNVDLKDGVLVDLLPGGFQIEDGSLATRDSGARLEKIFSGVAAPAILRRELRGDRYILFGAFPAHKSVSFGYNIRATLPGTYTIPVTQLEDMYLPENCGTAISKGTLTIQ